MICLQREENNPSLRAEREIQFDSILNKRKLNNNRVLLPPQKSNTSFEKMSGKSNSKHCNCKGYSIFQFSSFPFFSKNWKLMSGKLSCSQKIEFFDLLV